MASPQGGEAPLDPLSIQAYKDDKISTDFLETKKDFYTKSEPLSTVLALARAGKYDAIFCELPSKLVSEQRLL